MTQSVYYLKWVVEDQFDFKRFTFEHEAQVAAFKQKIWSDLSSFQAVSFQSESVHLARKKLCVFDMDSTLINQEVIDEIARLFGLYDQVAEITEAAMQGRLDFQEALRKRCSLFTGMPESRLQEILPRLSLSPGAGEFIRALKAQSIKTGIVSGGFEFVLRHFQELLGIDQVHGHTLELDAGKNFLGTVADPIIDANRKQVLVAKMKDEYQASTDETIVVGDGANDISMMKEAGISVSFCGKPKLNDVANTLILKRDLKLLEKIL
jgi:phosphoserine phosphatase